MKHGVAIALVVAGCGSNTATVAPSGGPEVVEFSGSASIDTAPFDLTERIYISSWTKDADCIFDPTLRSPTDPTFLRPLGGSFADGPTSGETWVYDVRGQESYYIEVFGSCNWTLKLTSAG